MNRLTAAIALVAVLFAAQESSADEPSRARVRANCGAESYTAGNVGEIVVLQNGYLCSNEAPSAAAPGISPTASTSAEGTHVFKASAGNLYSIEVSATAAGLLMIFDAASAPGDGAVTPKHCYFVAANQSFVRDWSPVPEAYTTGISVAFSSGTNCFNKTASATALFSADFK